MFCVNCGKQIPDGSKFCTGCGSQQQYTAPKPFQPYSSIDPNQGMVNKTFFQGQQQTYGTSGQIDFKGKGKKGRILKILLILLAVVIIGAIVIILLTKDKNGDKKLDLGDTTVVGSFDVPSTGATLEVDDPTSPIDGMQIEILPGTYDGDTTFNISTTEITDHDFGDIFDPVTPLISIDNGGDFADLVMTVSVPIEIGEDEFALAFYYDRENGALEAIPILSLTDSDIVLITAHFSELVVSKIKISKLMTYISSGIDSGFRPGTDDWQFVNYGSAIAPGGHCAGQSLTMAWYYYEQYLENNKPRLYGEFDNNGAYATEQFWQDDSYGYRFASVIQSSINWNAQDFQDCITYGEFSAQNTYYAFAYSMLVTKQPQFMAIYSHDAYGNATGGHAIVAYKVKNGMIYVADPNYPSQNNRYVAMGNGAFIPYSSGANAADINENGAVAYDEIIFVAKSALINFDTISAYYAQVLNGTIGADFFPSVSMSYLADYNNSTWTDINGIINITDQSSFPSEYQGTFTLAASAGYSDIAYTLYRETEMISEPSLASDDGYVYFTVPLQTGSNDYGLLVEYYDGEYTSYINFIRFQVNYGSEYTYSEEPSESSEVPLSNQDITGIYDFISRSDGSDIQFTYYYIQINSDGTYEETHQMQNDTYVGGVSGRWTIEKTENGDHLILDNSHDTYLISENYRRLTRIADIVFVFEKR